MSPLKRPVYALQLHFRVRFVLVAPGSLKILLRLLYTYAYEVKQIKIKYSTVHVHYMSRPCIMYCTWIMCTWTMYTHTVQYMYVYMYTTRFTVPVHAHTCTLCTCTEHVHVHNEHVLYMYIIFYALVHNTRISWKQLFVKWTIGLVVLIAIFPRTFCVIW